MVRKVQKKKGYARKATPRIKSKTTKAKKGKSALTKRQILKFRHAYMTLGQSDEQE